jgi:hypothetical protein
LEGAGRLLAPRGLVLWEHLLIWALQAAGLPWLGHLLVTPNAAARGPCRRRPGRRRHGHLLCTCLACGRLGGVLQRAAGARSWLLELPGPLLLLVLLALMVLFLLMLMLPMLLMLLVLMCEALLRPL